MRRKDVKREDEEQEDVKREDEEETEDKEVVKR